MLMHRLGYLLIASLACCVASAGVATAQVAVENASEMKFTTISDAPSCFTMAVAKGDPDKGPSTLLVKGTAGCHAPMHFHSVTEQLVKGTARLQM